MTEDHVKNLYLGLLQSAEIVYLATIDSEGFPQIRAMVNLRNAQLNPLATEAFKGHDDDCLMYFTTHKSSDKMRHIKTNQLASVYFCDSTQRSGLLLAGKMEIASETKLRKELWQQRWLKHFPRGVEDPEYIVLRFIPSFAKGWSPQGPFQFKFAKK